MIPPRFDIAPDQIARVVATFYACIREHPGLGPVFAAHVADQVAFREKGELVAVDSPAGILHTPGDERIRNFLRTYHERNSF